MTSDFTPIDGPVSQLQYLRVSQREAVVHMRLDRAPKRNAINDAFLAELQTAFTCLPAACRVVVLSGAGAHFCAGLDLSDVMDRSVAEGILHSRAWHRAFELMQFGSVPIVAALQGAVIGGGLELAASAHIRVADRSTFYGLPEGQRGIFVGGGGSVRLPRLIGVSLMTDMMLTGRVLDAAEGQSAGLSNYLVDAGTALDTAIQLAGKIASNAPLSNFAVLQALPRIADMNHADGQFVEALMSAVAQGDDEAKQRVRAFLDKKSVKVGKP